jgi:hypothetical protein
MRSGLTRVVTFGVGVITMVVAIQQHIFAGTVPSAPEIDGASISAGLGVLAAGILILRSRRRTK